VLLEPLACLGHHPRLGGQLQVLRLQVGKLCGEIRDAGLLAHQPLGEFTQVCTQGLELTTGLFGVALESAHRLGEVAAS
jgi:hypothetical protein